MISAGTSHFKCLILAQWFCKSAFRTGWGRGQAAFGTRNSLGAVAKVPSCRHLQPNRVTTISQALHFRPHMENLVNVMTKHSAHRRSPASRLFHWASENSSRSSWTLRQFSIPSRTSSRCSRENVLSLIPPLRLWPTDGQTWGAPRLQRPCGFPHFHLSVMRDARDGFPGTDKRVICESGALETHDMRLLLSTLL